DRIVERLRVSYRRPAAEVTVKTKVARVVTLLGEIRSTPRGSTGPGRYPLPGRIRLVDFITEHGGLTAQADLNNTQLTRNDRTYVYNLSRAIFQADMTQNPLLDDGDLVWVPSLKTSSRRVLVLGDVRTPGLIELPEEVPIAETIARSGGFLSTAHKSHVVVVRGDLENPTLLTANFESLKKGDLAQNFMIQDGDMVFVSRRKLSSFRDVMSTFATPLSMVLTSVFIGRAIDNQ
ncbi:MAG: polysaccharide biosynthesis/export family protein, partial [Acidobacteriota bacterium]